MAVDCDGTPRCCGGKPAICGGSGVPLVRCSLFSTCCDGPAATSMTVEVSNILAVEQADNPEITRILSFNRTHELLSGVNHPVNIGCGGNRTYLAGDLPDISGCVTVTVSESPQTLRGQFDPFVSAFDASIWHWPYNDEDNPPPGWPPFWDGVGPRPPTNGKVWWEVNVSVGTPLTVTRFGSTICSTRQGGTGPPLFHAVAGGVDYIETDESAEQAPCVFDRTLWYAFVTGTAEPFRNINQVLGCSRGGETFFCDEYDFAVGDDGIFRVTNSPRVAPTIRVRTTG